ncbi:MAG: YbaK/EbsC family protein [Anaerolineales bacterium]|nr:MAG: YbaK/EbsC family protein [Anaerolineales bacterium]
MSVQQDSLSQSANIVQQALDTFGLDFHVQELPGSTRTASEAARAIGCHIGQIAKSLVFRFERSGEPLLVITSGVNRVDVALLGGQLGEAIKIAEAEFVREKTGFAIGGVPPLGHVTPLRTILDQDMMQYGEIWAAAGTPHAVFRLTPEELIRITGGERMRVC